MYERILVALDGSDLALRVLPHVEALARRFASHVTLLRAITPPSAIIAGSAVGPTPVARPVVDPTPLVEAERREATEHLEAVGLPLSDSGVNAEYEVREGDAAEVITRGAAELGADLIAMTTHGRGGLGRLVFGSVADAVLRGAPCPVLLVRVTADEATPG
jgi:nucleotide-binding universal stress UspA family protein